jgi:hypothetical protein
LTEGFISYTYWALQGRSTPEAGFVWRQRVQERALAASKQRGSAGFRSQASRPMQACSSATVTVSVSQPGRAAAACSCGSATGPNPASRRHSHVTLRRAAAAAAAGRWRGRRGFGCERRVRVVAACQVIHVGGVCIALDVAAGRQGGVLRAGGEAADVACLGCGVVEEAVRHCKQ